MPVEFLSDEQATAFGRFQGLFLNDSLEVPWCVVDYLSGQTQVSDTSVVKRYSERAQTAPDHSREIRRAYGFGNFSGPLVEELGEFLYQRALDTW